MRILMAIPLGMYDALSIRNARARQNLRAVMARTATR